MMSIVLLLCCFPPVSTVSQEEEQRSSGLKELNVYFFPLNPEGSTTHATGDSFIITCGSTEILVDAGATSQSASIITKKMEQVISDDGVWDYIIVTHPDEDHISAFPSGVFDKFRHSDDGSDARWKIKTLIDFDITKDDTVDFEGKEDLFSTNVYKSYANLRGYIVEASKANYYTASQCCWEQRSLKSAPKEGATNKFELDGGATLTILYNYYYDHRANSGQTVQPYEKNLLSVCFLIEHGSNTLLFTGDLEEYTTPLEKGDGQQKHGESLLIEYNEQLKNGVTFYKAGHHGSSTSSSEAFIDVIKPKYVVIPAVAGSTEYDLPSKYVMKNLRKYTENIYITEMAINKEVQGKEKTVGWIPYDGNITVTSNGSDMNVTTDKTLHTFVFDVDNGVNGVGHCVLAKSGNTEVLIDCGIYRNSISQINTMSFVDDIEKYCFDGKIEYLIVTGSQTECLSNILGEYSKGQPQNNGILGKFEIGTIIDFGNNTNISASASNGWLARYRQERDNLVKTTSCKYYVARDQNSFRVHNGFNIKIFNTEEATYQGEDNYSLVVLINFFGEKLLFTGDLTSLENAEERLVSLHENEIKDVTFFLSGGNGQELSNSNDLLKTIKPKYTVVNSNVASTIGCTKFLSYEACSRMAYYTQNREKQVYLMSSVDDENGNRNESIRFSIETKNGKVTKKEVSYVYLDEKVTTLETSEWYQSQKQ